MTQDIKEVVREKYGQAALRVTTGGSSCCGAGPATGCCDLGSGGGIDVLLSAKRVGPTGKAHMG